MKLLDPEDWIINNIEESLKRLNIDKHKGVLFHDSSQIEFMKAKIDIDKLKKMFNLDFFGLSVYKLDDFINLKSKYKFNLVQVPYNIFDRQIEKSNFTRIVKRNI